MAKGLIWVKTPDLMRIASRKRNGTLEVKSQVTVTKEAGQRWDAFKGRWVKSPIQVNYIVQLKPVGRGYRNMPSPWEWESTYHRAGKELQTRLDFMSKKHKIGKI